jgi:hypothetical protein
MHEPPVFAFTEAALFWVALVWAFLPEIRHSGIMAGAPSNTQDAGTLRLINIGSNVALLSAFIVSFLPWLVIPYPRLALYARTGLLVAGSLLRRYCFRTLGKYFTAAVTVSAAFAVNCVINLETHLTAAWQLGATVRQIQTVLDIARAVKSMAGKKAEAAIARAAEESQVCADDCGCHHRHTPSASNNKDTAP